MPSRFHFSNHPLVEHKLSQLRRPEASTKSKEYARLMRELGMLMAYEATQNLPLVTEPQATASKQFRELRELGRKPVLVPIVRSGLVLFEGVREVIATSYTGHIGIHNEDSRRKDKGPLIYFAAMPDDILERHVFVIDPIMISGATAAQAVKVLHDVYLVEEKNISFITLVVYQNAKYKLEADFKQISVYAAALDESTGGIDIIKDFDTMSERIYRSS